MQQAYERRYDGFRHYWTPVELTGICKKITGGTGDHERHYYQVQRRWFGIPLGKYWKNKGGIEFFDVVVETEYKCKCGEQK